MSYPIYLYRTEVSEIYSALKQREMTVPFSNVKLRVPAGFQNLLEGMAKEVLFMQPSDINSFAAVYFENLMKLREGE